MIASTAEIIIHSDNPNLERIDKISLAQKVE